MYAAEGGDQFAHHHPCETRLVTAILKTRQSSIHFGRQPMQAFCSPQMAISPITAARRAALHYPVSAALQSGYRHLTGVDEAGAGALAGPVVAAALQLAPSAKTLNIPTLDDSKRLSARRREQIFEALIACTYIRITVNVCPPYLVDELNVFNARMRAMTVAVQELPISPGLLFVDGNRQLKSLKCEQRAVVGGDARISVVAAASIVAKVVRDNIMRDEAKRFQMFSFHKHVGYGTQEHITELRRFGPCEIHRRSFKPVQEAIEFGKRR